MKFVAPASLILVLLLSSCGSSSDTSGESSGDTSVDTEIVGSPGRVDTTDPNSGSSTSLPSESAETTTTTTTLVPVRNTLAGVWRAPADAILSANLSNLGGLPMDCIGEIVMNLNDDGSFSRSGGMTCTIDDVQISGQVLNSSGTWDATATTLSVRITESAGYAEVIGPDGRLTRVPLPDTGYSSAGYTVDATTLRITFTDPSVGTVTQVYTRG